jgi:hypothetical protein
MMPIRDASPKPAAATLNPADRGFSAEELQKARAYLDLPGARAYLRARETANAADGRRHEPAIAPPIEARHVAEVLRKLPPSVRETDVHAIKSTPAMILRAAGEAARAEHVTGNTQAVASQYQAPQQRAALQQAARRSTTPSVGQGRC